MVWIKHEGNFFNLDKIISVTLDKKENMVSLHWRGENSICFPFKNEKKSKDFMEKIEKALIELKFYYKEEEEEDGLDKA